MAGPNRSALTRGPGYIGWNGIFIHYLGDLVCDRASEMQTVETSDYGPIDETPVNRVFKIACKLWGDLSQISVLFPTALTNPQPGTSLFGATDLPLTVFPNTGVNQLVYTTAQITKMANLYVGVDQPYFTADVEFTAIIGNTDNPETSHAYTTLTAGTPGTGSPDTGFTRAGYTRQRYTAGWTGKTGFTAGTVFAQKGFKVDWSLGLAPIPLDGFGTVDFSILSLIATCAFIPVGPTGSQIETASLLNTAFGVLASGSSANLVLTPTSDAVAPIITFSNAYINKSGQTYSATALNNSDMILKTTRAVTTGVPTAVVAFTNT